MSTSTVILGKQRAVLAHCLAFIAVLAAVPAMASAKAGGLDPSFGEGGKVIGREAPLVDMAKLRNGGVVVAGESAMYAYLPNGRPDRRFGANGVVKPDTPEGWNLAITGIAVDDRDRVILAGSAEQQSPGSSVASYAALERYLPSGRPDLKFGNGGAVITDFGLPRPVRGLNFPDAAQVPTPVDVRASGVAIDSRGRIVVTGTRAASYTGTRLGTIVPRPQAFAARLGPNGSKDTGFNGTGASPLPALASIGEPALDRHDGVYFLGGRTFLESPEGPRTVVAVHLSADGDEDHKFGNGGQQVLDSRFGSEEVQLTVNLDQKGRLLILSGARVERLEADGSVDRSFGRKGVATIKARGGEAALVGLVAGPNGLLVTGRLRSQPAPGEATYRLLFARLTSDGRLDRRFGSGGVVTTAFGGKSAAEGQVALRDGEGALVGGTATYGPRRPPRFVMARYLLKR